MTFRPTVHAFALILIVTCAAAARADVTLPPIFSDHMVLQRGVPVPVWGKASPGEKVTVEVSGQSATATADDSGHWMLKLPAIETGEPTKMTVTATGGKQITINDVLIGEVWDASGQSNMDWQVKQSADPEKEIAAARYPAIRFFRFPHTVSTQPTKEFLKGGKWEICTPENAPVFSAVAYYFAREILQKENVPVGIIQNAWGGMPAEAFTSEVTLKGDPDFAPLLEMKRNAVADKQTRQKYEKALADWQDKNLVKDPGNKGFEKGWAKPDFDDTAWKTMNLPSKWEKQGLKIDGAVWLRRTIDIPADWQGKDLTLYLGIIDDFDTTYFNDKQVGAIGRENPFAWATERKYTIPAKLVKPGKATVAVRVFDQWAEGGFNDSSMKLAQGDDARPLAGEWRYEIEHSVAQPDPLPMPPAVPPSMTSPNMPSNLFNGQVNPVIPYAIRGVIWYQGESNADRAEQYRKLFPAMIGDWRKHWNQGDFPFLFVQLANFGNWRPRPKDPADSTWAELREAQLMTLKKSPNTAMAVTIDIGDSADIHPKNKQDVGKRLALGALKLAYGKDVQHAGPLYDSMKIAGDKIRITFTHADGLTARDGPPKGFQIAGQDKKWVWADATIEGNQVVVSSKDIPSPVAVRYGWQDDPVVNLYNAAGLPASPFRTDDWPISTAGVAVPGGKPRR